jgi:hypothetical protein
MNCEKVRDQFSSLWEKELIPAEEEIIREHLSSCPECQKEFEGFAKTMGWLRSVGDVEVPKGFLPELYKKVEERKKAPRAEELKRKWFIFPTSFKLPAQAVAMVAIVFFVLYLTQMMPTEMSRQGDVEKTAPPLSEERKSEQVFAQKRTEHESRVLEITPETARPKDIEHLQAPTLKKREIEDAHIAQAKEETKKEEAPPPKSEGMASPQIEPKEAVSARIPTPAPHKLETESAAKEKSIMALKPPREITLRIMDREKAVSQLHELLKQFRGEMVTAEGNVFIASLPTDSLSEFEKELAGLSVPTRADRGIAKKQVAGSLSASPGMRREEVDDRGKRSAKFAADREQRTVIRILLIQE